MHNRLLVTIAATCIAVCWAVSAESRAYRATKQATTWQQRYNSEFTRVGKTAVLPPVAIFPSTVVWTQVTGPPQRPPDFGTSSKYWDMDDGLLRQSRRVAYVSRMGVGKIGSLLVAPDLSQVPPS